jgi:hypothetical protein
MRFGLAVREIRPMLLTSANRSFSLPLVLFRHRASRTFSQWRLVSLVLLPCLLFWTMAAGVSLPDNDDYIPAPRSHYATHRLTVLFKPLKFERPELLKLALFGSAAVITVNFYLSCIVGYRMPTPDQLRRVSNLSVRAPPA